MIVGNGAIEHGAARMIDAADLVIRFNDCGSIGAGGYRTDVVAVCNTGRPALAMLGGGAWKSNPAVRQAREIWCTRSAERFAALRPELASTHPELDDFCDDYSSGFRTFAAMTGRTVVSLSAAIHAGADDKLAKAGAGSYVVPSSGMLVITYVLEEIALAADRVVVAGFSHTGWQGHPFAAERRYMEDLVIEGRVMRAEAWLANNRVTPYHSVRM